MLNIEQLRYFSTAVSSGGYSPAARKLFVTPQAVSKAVRQLEQESGGRLFTNIDGRMRATPEARALASHVDHVLETYDAIAPYAASLFSEGGVQPTPARSVCE